MRYWFYILAAITVNSCGGEKNAEKNPDKVKPQVIDTNNHYADTVPVIDSLLLKSVLIDFPKKSTFGDKVKLFEEKFAVKYNRIEPDKKHLLERFGNAGGKTLFLKKKMPVKYGNVENIYPVAQLRFLTYADSAQRANAVSNWFACFGNDCITIMEGEEIKSVKTTPGFYIINEKEIITLDYLCEHAENDWEEIKQNLVNGFASKKSIIIDLGCGGPLRWGWKKRNK